jgi:DDE superfamily endonuclease
MFWLSTSGHAMEIVPGLSGRDVKTTARRHMGSHPDEARITGAMRLRIRTQRDGHSVQFAPLEGWRRVKVTDRRTAVDYAQALEDLSDRHFPNAKKIVLVQDNLNTHKPASLYEAFPPDKARRLVERFEWHYTPKARQLARYGRIRTRGSPIAMPRPPHPRQANPHPSSRRMGG